MTPRQRQIHSFIHTYRSRHGQSPTVREIAEQLGISGATTHEHIDKMVTAGFLIRPSVPRARSLQPGRAVGKARTVTM